MDILHIVIWHINGLEIIHKKEEGGSRVIGMSTTYVNNRTSKVARITEIEEYKHEITS
jgi:hypothetical protein